MSKQTQRPARPEPVDEVATLRRRLEEATAKVAGLETENRGLREQVERGGLSGSTVALLEDAVKRSPGHVVRAFEAGARAERARALEQARISSLQWGGNNEVKRALDAFLKELRDERLPLPAYKPPECP